MTNLSFKCTYWQVFCRFDNRSSQIITVTFGFFPTVLNTILISLIRADK